MRKRLDERRQALAESNMGLAVHIAKSYRGLGVEISELVCEANLGLCEAARRFDFRRCNSKFYLYARIWIHKYLRLAIGAARAFPSPIDLEPGDLVDDRAELSSDERFIQRLWDGIENLTTKDRRILLDRFGITTPALTLPAMQKKHEMSPHLIRQSEQRSICHLADHLRIA